MDYEKILSELYVIRDEVEKDVQRRFKLGVEVAYPKRLKDIDAQITQIKEKLPKRPALLNNNHNNLISVASETEPFLFFKLSKSGMLSRDIGGEYQMEKDGNRYKIIKALKNLKKQNYYQTEDLSEVIGVSKQAIRKTIGDIKSQIEDIFDGIRGDDFIEGKKGSGYRLGMKVRIIEE